MELIVDIAKEDDVESIVKLIDNWLCARENEKDLKNVYVAEFDEKVVGYIAFSQNIHGNEFVRAVIVPYYSLSISYFR